MSIKNYDQPSKHGDVNIYLAPKKMTSVVNYFAEIQYLGIDSTTKHLVEDTN